MRYFTLVCLVMTYLAAPSNAGDVTPLRLVVMDPLAAPLSCPCVEGYAQRKYEELAKHLGKTLDRPVDIVFSGALVKALKETGGKADLIIGKHSVVCADARESKIKVRAVASLSGKDGNTTQHGLIVVNHDDPAQSVADLAGYEIIFGPSECDEKHSAAVNLLKKHGIAKPKKLLIDEACSDGATKVVEKGPQGKIAAVISSYAAPLLEGCGTIQKGDLRVVGKTEQVPFVTAFVSDSLTQNEQEEIRKVLLNINQQPELLTALETLVGFLPISEDSKGVDSVSSESSKKKNST